MSDGRCEVWSALYAATSSSIRPGAMIVIRSCRVSARWRLPTRLLADASMITIGERTATSRTQMTSTDRFTAAQAREVGEAIGIDWATAPFDVEQFRAGMDVE